MKRSILAVTAALAISALSTAARADVLITDTYTGNLSLNDTSYGLYGGGVYNGTATISFSVDTTLLATNGSVSTDNAYDYVKDGAVSETLSWGSYSETFAGGGNPYNWAPNSTQLWQGCTGCTDFGAVANNASGTGVMVSYWYNYSDPFTTQSVQNASDVLAVTNNTAYVQGYIGSSFGNPAPGYSAPWDYFIISGLQEVQTDAPEPATFTMLFGGLAAAALVRRRFTRR